MNDVLNAFTKLRGSDGAFSVAYHGDSDEVSEFINYTANCICKGDDNPDAYFVLNDNLLVIEHFKIDCSKKTRKGSSSLKDIARTDREFAEMLNDPNQNTYHSTITAPTSYSFFIKNAIDTFNSHYKRIDTYIRNVKKQENVRKFQSTRICFMIEDASIIPPMVLMNNKMLGIMLTQCEEFLLHFKKCSQVDWLLYLPSDNNQRTTEPKGFFCSQKYMDDYLNNTEPYANMEFLSWQPKVIGGKTPFIPNSKK